MRVSAVGSRPGGDGNGAGGSENKHTWWQATFFGQQAPLRQVSPNANTGKDAALAPPPGQDRVAQSGSLWQQVNSSRKDAPLPELPARQATEAAAAPTYVSPAKGAAPLWSTVHQDAKPQGGSFWQQVNSGRSVHVLDSAVPVGDDAPIEAAGPAPFTPPEFAAPLWSKVHNKSVPQAQNEGTSLWQQVNGAREGVDPALVAFSSSEAEAAPQQQMPAASPAPLWAKVHEDKSANKATPQKSGGSFWELVNGTREGVDPALIPISSEVEAAPQQMPAAAPAPLWAKVHEDKSAPKKSGSFWERVNGTREGVDPALIPISSEAAEAPQQMPAASPAPFWSKTHMKNKQQQGGSFWQTVNNTRAAAVDEPGFNTSFIQADVSANQADAPPPQLTTGAAPMWAKVHEAREKAPEAGSMWQQVNATRPEAGLENAQLSTPFSSEAAEEALADPATLPAADGALWSKVHRKAEARPFWQRVHDTGDRESESGVVSLGTPLGSLARVPGPPPKVFKSKAPFWMKVHERGRADEPPAAPVAVPVPPAPARQPVPTPAFAAAAQPAYAFEAAPPADPSLNMSLVSAGTSISQLFDQDKWERHRQVNRYFRNLRPWSIFTSTVVRRVFSPCLLLASIAALVCAYNLVAVPYALQTGAAALPLASLNSAPFLLLAPIIGLLLVFRTNGSYARFAEGRLLWGFAVRHSRDVARIVCTYLAASRDRSLILGYLTAWPWILKAHVRTGRTRTDPNDPTAYREDPTPEVNEALPADQAAKLLAAANRPYVCLMALSMLLNKIKGSLPEYARVRVEECIVEMGAVAGGCERILSTPMPLSYTRFTARALMLWLMAMPLALWPLMGWATVPALFFMSYVVIGIDEIGVEIEEPFCILPLQDLSNAIKRDVQIAAAEADQYREMFAVQAAAAAAPAQASSMAGNANN